MKNPCPQWLTKNETRREEATERAKQLNAQYHKIIRERSSYYKNFKMYYMDFPFEEIARRHFERGGDLKDLIDPVREGKKFFVNLNSLMDFIHHKSHKTYLQKKFGIIWKKISQKH